MCLDMNILANLVIRVEDLTVVTMNEITHVELLCRDREILTVGHPFVQHSVVLVLMV